MRKPKRENFKSEKAFLRACEDYLLAQHDYHVVARYWTVRLGMLVMLASTSAQADPNGFSRDPHALLRDAMIRQTIKADHPCYREEWQPMRAPWLLGQCWRSL